MLQKWDEPAATSSVANSSLPLQQSSPSQLAPITAAGPVTVVPEQLEESLLHRAARTGNLVSPADKLRSRSRRPSAWGALPNAVGLVERGNGLS